MSHDGCKMPTPSQAHCATCHRTFGGVWGFDAHRKNGQCLDPSTIGFREVNRIWREIPKHARPQHWKARKGEGGSLPTPKPAESF